MFDHSQSQRTSGNALWASNLSRYLEMEVVNLNIDDYEI